MVTESLLGNLFFIIIGVISVIFRRNLANLAIRIANQMLTLPTRKITLPIWAQKYIFKSFFWFCLIGGIIFISVGLVELIIQLIGR